MNEISLSKRMTEYKDKIASILEGDDKAAEMIIFESNRKAYLSLQARYPFLFHGLLAIFTNIVYPLFGLRRLVEIGDEDFLFVSCPDPIFRTKTISMIAGRLNYSIIYLPNYHILSALRYYKFFKENGTKVFFPTIRLRYVLKAKKRFGDQFDEQKFRETNARVQENQQKRDALHERYAIAMNKMDLDELKQIIL